MASRQIVLCADDYGLSPGISRGIRELLATARLSATSCMTIYPEFAADGPKLRPYLDSADIGLHFTLTDTDRSLAAVAAGTFLRPPKLADIIREVERQAELFEEIVGAPPAYIDGHQHIHLFPVIRDAVVEVAKKLGAYVRVTTESLDLALARRPAAAEAAWLSLMSRTLARLAQRNGVPTNNGFRGPRNFREKTEYRDLFCAMIAGVGDGCIVMCHPGHSDAMLAERDNVLQARDEELRYFASDDFPRDLANANLTLGRLRFTA